VKAVPAVRDGDTIAPAGEVSNFLHDNVFEGDRLEVSLPFGELELTEGESPLVLVSAGIGITPMIGFLRHLRDTGSAREVVVHRLELLSHKGDTLQLLVECSSGTYVRSLVTDLGAAWGCGAHLSALRRTWVDPFRDPRMVTMGELEQAAEQGEEALLGHLLPVAEGLRGLPWVDLDEAQAMAVSRGQPIRLGDSAPAGRCAAFAPDGALLAVIELDEARRSRILRGFNLPPPGGFA